MNPGRGEDSHPEDAAGDGGAWGEAGAWRGHAHPSTATRVGTATCGSRAGRALAYRRDYLLLGSEEPISTGAGSGGSRGRRYRGCALGRGDGGP
eukprot:5759205-Pyramimonas_sp.AAC.1